MQVVFVITVVYSLLSVCSSVIAQPPQAQGSSAGEFRKVGAAGAQFLKIGVGARANGMAGAFTAIANDPSALFYNNAGIVDIKGYMGSFSYIQWFGGYSHNFIAGIVPMGENYRAALSVTSFTSGPIPFATIQDENRLNTTYSITDVAIGGTFAAQLTDQFSFGVTLKYIQNGIGGMSASGILADVGTMYRFRGVRLGFSISNLGPPLQFSGGDLNFRTDLLRELQYQQIDASYLVNPFNAPISLKAGLAADLTTELLGLYDSDPNLAINQSREHRWLMALEFETLSDVPEQLAIGTEYTWNDLLSIRAGYRYNQSVFGFSGGIGIRYIGSGFEGMLDYSIHPSSTLGIVNRFSLTVRLD
ncbi:MAG: PorV/PorQ family protein [Bacteroidota bacterium]|nr:PorV/PorQ family protein [Candidatus Kapabacteria bacterium]MCS7302479.1 PorV/PorQ family protein [Candidatus Kapabacteria bacterium]MCX7936369.1 PorV/PorQ family protein [Chlorobiota bacterium]MDW8074350.1 PorV/PorQ family protein [Bacteroidota bacterium]MDW8271174.1 PorV/PorQ family protein [Bacteroidota bacterium]